MSTEATDLRTLNQGRMTGEDLREQICGTLNEALPALKHAVRQYMTRDVVHDKDFKQASAIWRALDSIEDTVEKLGQSEF